MFIVYSYYPSVWVSHGNRWERRYDYTTIAEEPTLEKARETALRFRGCICTETQRERLPQHRYGSSGIFP